LRPYGRKITPTFINRCKRLDYNQPSYRQLISDADGITDFSYPRPFVPKHERSLWRTFVPWPFRS